MPGANQAFFFGTWLALPLTRAKFDSFCGKNDTRRAALI